MADEHILLIQYMLLSLMQRIPEELPRQVQMLQRRGFPAQTPLPCQPSGPPQHQPPVLRISISMQLSCASCSFIEVLEGSANILHHFQSC